MIIIALDFVNLTLHVHDHSANSQPSQVLSGIASDFTATTGGVVRDSQDDDLAHRTHEDPRAVPRDPA